MKPMNNVLFVSLSEADAYKRENIFNNGTVYLLFNPSLMIKY